MDVLSHTKTLGPSLASFIIHRWAKDAANDMASRLVNFYPEEFEPNKAITRADFLEA